MDTQFPLFDTHVVVDWSARSKPSPKRPSGDAIWWAVASEGVVQRVEYVRTRHDAVAGLHALIAAEAAVGRRMLVGFDIPFGYPAGVAEHLTGSASAFALWDWVTARVDDGSDNGNNRFAVAEEINRRYPGIGPCWGRPLSWHYPDIPTCGNARTCQRSHPAEHRLSDVRAKGAKTLWQLFYNGSVGSQVLVGLPALQRLRKALGGQVAVWPLEGGLGVPDAPVVFAEIYPSLLRAVIARRREQGEILDRAQVRVNAEALSRLDCGGGLAPLFEGHPDLTAEERAMVETEEAWVLGLGHEHALNAALWE